MDKKNNPLRPDVKTTETDHNISFTSKNFIFTKNKSESGTFLLKSLNKKKKNKKYYKYSYLKNNTPIKILKSIKEKTLDLYKVKAPGGVVGFVLKKNIKKIQYNKKNIAVISIISPHFDLISENNTRYTRSDNILFLVDKVLTQNGRIKVDVIDINKDLRFVDYIDYDDKNMEFIPLKPQKALKQFSDKEMNRSQDIKALKEILSWDCNLEKTISYIENQSTLEKTTAYSSAEISLIAKYFNLKIGIKKEKIKTKSKENESRAKRIIKEPNTIFKASVFGLYDMKNLTGKKYAVLKKHSCDINSSSTKKLLNIKLINLKTGDSCIFENEKIHTMFDHSANSNSLFVLNNEYFSKHIDLDPFSVDYYMSSVIRNHFYKCEIFDDFFNVKEQGYFLKELLKPIFLDYYSFNLVEIFK